MLGAGRSGAMQLRGRISVVPSGQLSPGWIAVTGRPPRAPGRPVCECAAPVRIERTLTATRTDAPRMKTPGRTECGNLPLGQRDGNHPDDSSASAPGPAQIARLMGAG